MIGEDILKKGLEGIFYVKSGGGLNSFLNSKFYDNKFLRKKVASLLYSYYRNKISIEYVVSTLLEGNKKNFLVYLLSLVAIQKIFQCGISDRDAGNIAVEFTKKRKGKKIAGVVNAVIRKLTAEYYRNQLYMAPEYVRKDIPEFFLAKLKQYYSRQEIDEIIEANKTPANLTFRLTKNISDDNSSFIENNFIELNKEELCNKFNFYLTEYPENLIQSEILSHGEIYIQDIATTLSFDLLDFYLRGNIRLKKILDLCSAPGGKTLMLSEVFPESKIYAMDRDFKRIKKVENNVKNLNAQNIELLIGDAVFPPFKEEKFDLIFADVPCSNTGVIRRRPDVTTHLSEKSFVDLINLQRKIVESSYKLLKSGGFFLYSTCSIDKEENTFLINEIVSKNDNLTLIKEKQILPSKSNDGAYAALLQYKN